MPGAAPPPPAQGDLVGLIEQGKPRIGVLASRHGKRAVVRIGVNGERLQRGLGQLDRIMPLPEGAAMPDSIAAPPWSLRREDLMRSPPPRRELGMAWLLLREGNECPDLGAFTGMVAEADDPAQRAACWRWLQGEQSLFRWHNGRVEPRSPAELRLLRQQRRRRQLSLEERRRWREALRQRRPIEVEGLGAESRRQLEQLRRWAAGDRNEELSEDLHRSLQAAHCAAEPGTIRHLLVDLGQWPRHHLPSLAGSHWSEGFPEEARREAEQLLQRADAPLPGDALRVDRTGLRSVTIDDEDTEDIDDGLALERRAEGGERLWIHVADPGRLVEPESALDREARRRGSSLYLARGSLPMFPSELVRGPFSLTAGRRCPAWSVWVDLGEDGSVRQAGIENTWVRPIYRLSYADADELISLAPPQEEDLARIHRLMELRHGWRLRRGALAMEQPEGRIRVVDGQAELEIIEPSPARRMVAEAMVLAGTVVAEHGRRHGLALPFRSQLRPDLPPAAELASLPAGPVRHAALRRCLGRGRMGTSPAPHFSLGLEAYVQATSPIRRYGDLLAQRQLRAVWSGAEAMTAHRLGNLLETVEAPIRQAIQIAREDQRHWLQVWFEQQERRQWRGLFLRWLRQKDLLGLVHVEEMAMDLPATCPADAVPAGELLVRLVAVDSLRDQLTLHAVA